MINEEFSHVSWSNNANIYEVNLRQYTKEGTIKAFMEHLPRLREMGVDIIWLMPIHPVGLKNKKGSLGSQYAVRDYKALDESYGTLDDLKILVKETHNLGMHIIIDWVANHTAWDNVWVTEHPEWYKKDAEGNIHSYIFEEGDIKEYWTDVVGLDYTNKALWLGMLDALKYWVSECHIDGYRCDVAGLVPTEFWNKARLELDKIKPIFMLAEWAGTALHETAFDMTYNWDLYDLMKAMAEGDKDVLDLKDYLQTPDVVYPKFAYRMNFTTNHDKNTWVKDDVSLYGDAFKAYTVLTVTLPGMPLIYSGQESVLDKQIEFFERDLIDWENFELSDFYRGMLSLKRNNPLLWNGELGGDLEILDITTKSLLGFRRYDTNCKLTILINFKEEPATVEYEDELIVIDAYGYKLM